VSIDGWGVLVPVKAFSAAKARLAPALDPDRRALMARSMATRVVLAADPLPVAVVCDDLEVAAWAESLGATVFWEPRRGLNGAVESGVARLAAGGTSNVIVVHGDLPFAHDLPRLAGFAGITLVPDRREDGTNVVCLPASSGFRFSYGPGSFARHRAEARRIHMDLQILHIASLAWDVDVPEDIPDPPPDGGAGLRQQQ
jgi:2-phospho-L-lactate guanylyltransferase